METLVELHQICKTFGAIKALSNVDLIIHRGSIHALVGENGAGKSTLGKILTGIYVNESGSIIFNDKPVKIYNPRDALSIGIAGIQQEVILVPQMTVLENVFLGIDKSLRKKDAEKKFTSLCAQSGFTLPPDQKVLNLSLADKKKVELLRALARDSKLIVIDELTASMDDIDAKKLLSLIKEIKKNGTSVLYVSHHLEEVLSIADEITILRNGQVVRSSQSSDECYDSLVEGMVGREVDISFPPKNILSTEKKDPAFCVSNFTRKGKFDKISFSIREGEIIGLAGLVGSGRTEIVRAIYGVDPIDSGDIFIYGEKVRIKSPHQAIKCGICFLPEDRKFQGLIMSMSGGHNVTLPHLKSLSKYMFIKLTKERKMTQSIFNKLDVRPNNPKVLMRNFSGGNQQKVMFAKGLFRQPKILIADEPTRGVDVHARRTIYSLINSLAENGMPILIISSDIEEIIGLAHRVYVISNGQVNSVLEGANITQEEILKSAFRIKKPSI